MRTLWVSAALVCIASAVSAAQTRPQQWSADLARYYFASAEAEAAARADLDAQLKKLETYKGQLDSATRLLETLQTYDDAIRLLRMHTGYLHFRCAQDRKDPACGQDDRLESEFEARTASLTAKILAIPEARLQAFLRAEPPLNGYRFMLQNIRRDAAHVLPTAQAELIGKLRPEIGDWQYELYDKLLGSINFGTVQTSAGPLEVIRQRNLLAANPDPHVREEAFKRRMNGFASQRDLFAFSLIHTVNAQNALAKAHHYEDAPTRKYTELYLEPERTKQLLQAMAQQGEVAKRFEKIRAADVERAYPQAAHAWDLSAPQPGFTPPITPLRALPGLFRDVFATLGAEYEAAFDALLNPANGRADVIPGGTPNRYGGDFSIGFTGSTSMLFYGRYDGTFKDLSVIAHEGGHAVHRSLMTANHVRPVYASGPHYLFESFAEFNELLLADYLAEHSSDPRLRRFYLEQWLGIKGLDAFYGAQDALLEQAIYDGVAKGRVGNADDLDKLTVQIDSEFSIFPATTPELRNRWIAVSLMYEDPLYDVNYVYGGLLALKYYQLYTTNRERFVTNYLALLKNGFDAPPATLLKKFLNIDLFSPQLVKDDIEVLNSRLNQLDEHEAHKSSNGPVPGSDY